MKTADALVCRQSFKNGEPSRARTCDPLIKSQLLYQLSYRPSCDARKIIRAVGGVSSKHTWLTRRCAFTIRKELVDGVDEPFDVGLGYECGGAGGERFAAVNLVGVAGVKDARHSRRNFH